MSCTATFFAPKLLVPPVVVSNQLNGVLSTGTSRFVVSWVTPLRRNLRDEYEPIRNAGSDEKGCCCRFVGSFFVQQPATLVQWTTYTRKYVTIESGTLLCTSDEFNANRALKKSNSVYPTYDSGKMTRCIGRANASKRLP